MDNSQMNFDPMTGQPINQNTNNSNMVPNNGMTIPTEQNNIQSSVPTQTESVNNINVTPSIEPSITNVQQSMQNIATVEQSKQEFIENTQANSSAKKEEKKDGPNIAFIIILFVIIFAAILFLFPYLQKTL